MTTLTAEQNAQLREIAANLSRMERKADTLRSLLTASTPGAANILRDHQAYLTAARNEIAKVRAGGLWHELDEQMYRARNTAGLVAEMIDSIRHPEKVARDAQAIDHLP